MFSGVYAALIVRPVNNTVALAGTSVQLNCAANWTGSPRRIVWLRNPHMTDILREIVRCYSYDNRQPDLSFPQYSVVSTSAGQCDLVINNASLELATMYMCRDYDELEYRALDWAYANLTVVGE